MFKLPLDSDVSYFRGFLEPEESTAIFRAIQMAADLSDRVLEVNGERFDIPLGKVIFADESTIQSKAFVHEGPQQTWIPEVLDLKNRVEKIAQRRYGVCVCIYYQDGTRGCDFHVDLPAFGDLSSIASVSLGEQRVFALRSISDPDDVYTIDLEDGSLLVMGPRCQDRYQHAVLVDPRRTQPRLNLTFRPLGWD